ncbi:fibrobacter succinogenes major paralogous domain-containing protein [Flavobacteriaceae bacterium]|nr:fibrobacter succinogenes major paralogous domain-containing protein [Flavobacteriaceae bacterium]
MKKLFILLLIIPILGFSQNDLVFNRVLNFKLNANETVTVPTDKAWKIEGASETQIIISNESPAYGSAVDNQNHFASTGTHNAIWLGAGSILHSKNGGTQPMSFSILEFNVVAASSSSGNGGDTGNSTNNNDGYSSNSSSSSSSNSYDGNNSNLSTPGDDFTDSEGNTYSTTVVDGLVWTTSNANHSTYRDGTPIEHITDYQEWKNATTGAWTYFAQDGTLGYGKLYNFHAINGRHDNDPNTENKIFAPVGWRVPSWANWKSLCEMFVYGNNSTVNSASALKSTTGWTVFNGTNHSGLNIKPGGFIYGGYSYTTANDPFLNDTQNIGQETTRIWSSTQNGNQQAFGIRVYNSEMFYVNLNGTEHWVNTSFDPGAGASVNGNSGNYVRLVKDAN